jgi:hypothetical protein
VGEGVNEVNVTQYILLLPKSLNEKLFRLNSYKIACEHVEWMLVSGASEWATTLWNELINTKYTQNDTETNILQF